ncbi:unnamed protein product [Trifolium pratense]|uniref:Uncharacterized protein n=1 Tax=Trifolium pratense TaxID=57577 RepID=A0ACB0IX84_TRIPR|nr:unnamed protein product [Trifolium pratense]
MKDLRFPYPWKCPKAEFSSTSSSMFELSLEGVRLYIKEFSR